jgi:cytosine/adenosine deaminase-related metal-dependent hydrolase
MILNNLRTALQGHPVNIRTTGDRIAEISVSPLAATPNVLSLDLGGAMVFPGLINSHDHLDFNLFPALGDRTYDDYTEWGNYIHQNYKEEIDKVLRIPMHLREAWGIYKNLLCGVTTVVNHGEKIKKPTSLITVHEDCQSIHSVQFGKKWKLSLNNPLKKNVAAAIHTGEGTTVSATREIDTLSKWNLLKRPVIGVHGVAMSAEQAKDFKALIWCPESNYFMLNRTAPVDLLKAHTAILFGTDSTLTGSWNIWEHIRLARRTGYLADQEIFDSLTVNAALAWKLQSGKIAPYKYADLVIARNTNGAREPSAFFDTGPEDLLMVLHNGHVSLFDEELLPQLKNIDLANYSRVYIKGAFKYVAGDVQRLMIEIRFYNPQVSFPVS